MKRVLTVIAVTLLMITGCSGNRQSGNRNDDFITVDVTASYPGKELILQDFLDVEYIPLETTGEFLCQGLVLDIGKEIIAVRNQINDGDIFIFDRKGKGIRKINRRGQGPEEYISLSEITLDEDNGEMFVNDFSSRRIIVYDLFGKFVRSFRYQEGAMYKNMYKFDGEKLICYDAAIKATDKTSFFILSKQDGSIMKDIQIYFKEKKAPTGILFVGGGPRVNASSYFPIIPYAESWILSEYSADTVFRLMPDYSMLPFIERIPSIQSGQPEILLYPGIITDRYLFMKTEMNELGSGNMVRGVSIKDYLVYDNQDKAIYKYTIFNDDFSPQKSLDMSNVTINSEIAFWQKLETYALLEDFEKGQLKGKLKKIAAELEEESNPVIMLAKYKK